MVTLELSQLQHDIKCDGSTSAVEQHWRFQPQHTTHATYKNIDKDKSARRSGNKVGPVDPLPCQLDRMNNRSRRRELDWKARTADILTVTRQTRRWHQMRKEAHRE
jgi:hypothetical protein